MFANLVQRARSFRRFQEDEPVTKETLRQLVDMARIAPCGGNQQLLSYRIVYQPEERELVFPRIRWAAALKDWTGPVPGERPTGYIAIYAPAGKNPAIDLGIAAQTIQLGATALGYGACMLGSIDREFISIDLGVPDTYALLLLVAIGRPGEAVLVEEMPESGDTAYWRSPDGKHHVPKRSLDDVLIG